MPDYALLSLFIPTIFLVSISPGMCMTLAMTLGLQLGVKKTLWMMFGEVIGVASVAILSVLTVASLVHAFPWALLVLKWIGASYLMYVAYKTWQSVQGFSTEHQTLTNTQRFNLFSQGFVTAISNPKGWAFMVALLPPLLDEQKSLVPQLSVFVFIIMLSEFLCMLIYANSGKALRRFFLKDNNAKYLNQITALLLVFVGIWLVTM